MAATNPSSPVNDLLKKALGMPSSEAGNRSKLVPFKEVIMTLEGKGYSLQKIAAFLKEEANVTVSPTAVRYFIGQQKDKAPKPPGVGGPGK